MKFNTILELKQGVMLYASYRALTMQRKREEGVLSRTTKLTSRLKVGNQPNTPGEQYITKKKRPSLSQFHPETKSVYPPPLMLIRPIPTFP